MKVQIQNLDNAGAPPPGGWAQRPRWAPAAAWSGGYADLPVPAQVDDLNTCIYTVASLRFGLETFTETLSRDIGVQPGQVACFPLSNMFRLGVLLDGIYIYIFIAAALF